MSLLRPVACFLPDCEGKDNEALEWNSYSMRVFIFFAVQLFMRISLALVTMRGNIDLRRIAVTDAAVSSVMTLAAFYPFLRMLWISMF